MSKARFEWKVGLFVLIGLALLAGLMLQFSKGLTFFRPTYDIYLQAPNVAGLKKNAGVLMSGVQVGMVSDIQLAPGGRTVTITLRIYKNFTIHRDARFVIEQAGFLGDQYVGIVPTDNKKPPFEHGDKAEAEAPFNLQEFTRSASGFISRVDETIKKLNDALADVSRMLLNPETLTNLSVTAQNLREFSERAITTMDDIRMAVVTNSPALSVSSSNLVVFSEQLNHLARDFRSLVATNREDITDAVKNIESSSESLKAVMSDLQAGKGLAGNLLKDEHMAVKMSQIADNLSITTSNLNRLGLWRMMWQQKPPKTNSEPAKPLPSPKAQP